MDIITQKMQNGNEIGYGIRVAVWASVWVECTVTTSVLECFKRGVGSCMAVGAAGCNMLWGRVDGVTVCVCVCVCVCVVWGNDSFNWVYVPPLLLLLLFLSLSLWSRCDPPSFSLDTDSVPPPSLPAPCLRSQTNEVMGAGGEHAVGAH